MSARSAIPPFPGPEYVEVRFVPPPDKNILGLCSYVEGLFGEHYELFDRYGQKIFSVHDSDGKLKHECAVFIKQLGGLEVQVPDGMELMR